MTHTPGKWSSWTNHEVRVVRDERGARICQMAYLNGHGRRSDDEVKSNAQLIAAAPDLLAACESALDQFEAMARDVDTNAWCAELRAAIKKARGEA